MKYANHKLSTALVATALAVANLQAQDLPYSSGSTGADGAFNVDITPGFTNRREYAATFDGARGEVMIFGGFYFSNFPASAAAAARTDTWVWDGSDDSWTQRATTGTISSTPRRLGTAFHEASGLVVAYGGFGSGYAARQYSWDGTAWTTVSSSAAPGVRAVQAMAYDGNPGVEEVIMFGGYNGSVYLNSTWAWDGTVWTNKAPATSPSARGFFDMAWDDERDEIVMFGGAGATGSLNDTWVWKNGNWTEKTPATVPPARSWAAIGYDPVSKKIIMHGGSTGSAEGAQIFGDTWAWDGTDWAQVFTTRALTARNGAKMVTDTTNGELLLVGGGDFEFESQDDTWLWDSTLNGGAGDWVQLSGSRYMVDCSEKADGVWNYTSINVPAGVTVDFVPNDNNSPVTWLASEAVLIDGKVSVDGRAGWTRNNVPAMRAPGGSGGFAGGVGGTRVEVYDTRSGTPGFGPGGGAPGITSAQTGGNGTHSGVYGNVYVIPPVGGSGGGGAASSSTLDGGNGGGGGGVIIVASSRDITVNGSITARGGHYGRNGSHNGPNGGHGAGGAIKLVSDRLHGTGTVETRNGGNLTSSNLGGYVRLESYLKPFNISGTVTTGTRSDSAPVAGVTFGNQPTLAVTNIAGAGVAQPPSGGFFNPDVVFSEAGTVTITVTGTNIPDGTEVTCRVTTPTTTINLPAAGTVTLSGGTADFTTTVPAGFGTVQAFAAYDVTLP